MSEGDRKSEQKPLSEDQLIEILSKCYPGYSPTILTADEAARRGRLIHEQMAQVGFPLVFHRSWAMPLPEFETLHVPSYALEGGMYGPIADPDGSLGRDAAGPMLSCGEFVRLSRACSLGAELLGDSWPMAFKSRLRDPDDHLATVEEVLWLGRWYSPSGVERGYRQNVDSGKDVDWRFRTCDQIVNLEVKYRRRDWKGVTDGDSFSRRFDSYFDDLRGKFGPQQDGELNVVGITTFCPPDRDFKECIGRFLEETPEVDAVVIWSLHDPEGERPVLFGPKADLVRLLLTEDHREENMIAAPIMHLWRKREERRALRTDEALEAMIEEANRVSK